MYGNRIIILPRGFYGDCWADKGGFPIKDLLKSVPNSIVSLAKFEIKWMHRKAKLLSASARENGYINVKWNWCFHKKMQYRSQILPETDKSEEFWNRKHKCFIGTITRLINIRFQKNFKRSQNISIKNSHLSKVLKIYYVI